MRKLYGVSWVSAILLVAIFFQHGHCEVRGEVRKILLIASESGEPYQSVIDSFTSQLAQTGYVKDRNLEIRQYSIDHYEGRAKRILQDGADRKYDLTVVLGTVATKALKKLILGDPQYEKVVFSTVTDPVGLGVVEDFKNPPKYNFTGVAYPVPVRKRFDFIRRLMPKARKIGLIYADMPQSHSYNKWVKDFLAGDPEYKDYEILFREVPFAKGEGGKIRMSRESEKFIRELDPKVDLFLSANDQLALQPFFPKLVYDIATKPLVGVGGPDVTERRGATASIFPTSEGLGRQTAKIVKRLLDGASIKEVVPEEANEFGIAFDMEKVRKFSITVPEDLLKQAGNNIVP